MQAQLPVTAVTHIKGKDPKEKDRDKEKERERERAAANAVKQQLAAQPGLQCAPHSCLCPLQSEAAGP